MKEFHLQALFKTSDTSKNEAVSNTAFKINQVIHLARRGFNTIMEDSKGFLRNVKSC